MTVARYRTKSDTSASPGATMGIAAQVMKGSVWRAALAAFAAGALTAAAGAAAAQQAPVLLVSSDFTDGSHTQAVTTPRRSMEWDSRRTRWGLKLGVEQHTDRDVQWKDVAPGVYYKITPRLHIGGAVSLAPDDLESQKLLDPQMPAPRVRLETTFKF